MLLYEREKEKKRGVCVWVGSLEKKKNRGKPRKYCTSNKASRKHSISFLIFFYKKTNVSPKHSIRLLFSSVYFYLFFLFWACMGRKGLSSFSPYIFISLSFFYIFLHSLDTWIKDLSLYFIPILLLLQFRPLKSTLKIINKIMNKIILKFWASD